MENETLKLTSPLMHGPAVVRLQEMLDLFGLVSGQVGSVDGIFGPWTQFGVAIFQKKNGLKRDGICGPKTWKAIIRACEEYNFAHPDFPVSALNGIHDRRGHHQHPRLYKCKRPWSAITGVTLHQTGCAMPSNPAGWDKLNAHIGISRVFGAALANDPTDFIWHAQGLSESTIAIEIEGNYMGVDGDHKTLWKGGGGPHHLNPGMIDALETVRLYLSDEFTANGSEWKNIYAHRQSAKSRIGDPGEEIWKNVALPWADRLGLDADFDGNETFQSNYCIGSGRPIPRAWYSWYSAPYYAKR